MGLRGPKPWSPSAEQIAKIKLYAGLGMTQEQAAKLMGKSVNGFKNSEAAKEAFELGKAEIIAKIAGKLVQKALAGDSASIFFYLKTQAGWRETLHVGGEGPGGAVLFMLTAPEARL